jgi:hypothetical protein
MHHTYLEHKYLLYSIPLVKNITFCDLRYHVLSFVAIGKYSRSM